MNFWRVKNIDFSLTILLAVFAVFFLFFVFSRALAGECPLPQNANGGTITLPSCYISSGKTVGVDNGYLVIPNGTTLQMDSNAELIFEPGYSITVNGYIAKNSRTAIIRKASYDLAAAGSLACASSTASSISLDYGYSNGSSVSLFRGTIRLATFGSGSGSGMYNDIGLASGTPYSYSLWNGTSSSSTLLASQTCSTSAAPVSGSISCSSVTSNSITLSFSYSNLTSGYYLYRGSTLLSSCGSCSNGAGNYPDSGLSPSTSYTYYLRYGLTAASPILSQTICATSAAAACTGNISCTNITATSIGGVYSWHNCAGFTISVFRDNRPTAIDSVSGGSGTGAGNFSSENSLCPGTNSTFYLRKGTSSISPLLASVTCKTNSIASGLNVFVSSTGHDGNFGGRVGANQWCNFLAQSSPIGVIRDKGSQGKYKAWLSTSGFAAKNLLPSSNNYWYTFEYNPGTNTCQVLTIADSRNDFFGASYPEGLVNSIHYTDSGGNISSDPVWTGTRGIQLEVCSGAASESTCSDWTSNSSSNTGTRGGSGNSSTGTWTDSTNCAVNINASRWPCNYSNYRLYCFEYP